MYNLLGHMHLHAGSKPFKCPYCTSKFNLKGNLSRHMKVKHGMDVSPEGQGEAASQDRGLTPVPTLGFICVCVCFLEVLPEMENQGEYDGQNFSFTSADSLDNGGSQNLTKLTTANMDDMEEYYNFGKDTSTYATP